MMLFGFMLCDIGIPMLAITYPISLISLIIFILLEALIGMIMLKIDYKKSLINFTIANLWSTLVGIPVVYICLVIIQMLWGGGGDVFHENWIAAILQAAWLLPNEENALKWMVPVSALVLNIPFFFGSLYIEYRVIKKRLSKDALPVKQIFKSVLMANIASYLLLELYWLILLLRR